MTQFQIYSLAIDFFTAIGTCGATILALYFWLNDKRIKLGFRCLHADTYGMLPNVDGGYFVAAITNRSNWPIVIESAGLKCFENKCIKNKLIGFNLFENTNFDRLPKKLEFGETYIYSIPMNDAIQRLRKFETENKVQVSDIQIFICITTAKKEIVMKIDNYVKSKLLQ